MLVLQKYLRLVLPALLVLCGTSSSSAAQTGGEWSSKFAGAGLDGHVWALAAGNGRVCAAGEFRYAGGRPAEILVCYDRDRRTWESLNIGPTIRTLAMDEAGDLYVGGESMEVDGKSVNAAVYHFDTGRWDTLDGDPPAPVSAFEFGPDGRVFAAASSGVYRYDGKGSTWSRLGTVSGAAGLVFSLAATDIHLYIGGSFTTVEDIHDRTVHCRNIAALELETTMAYPLGGGFGHLDLHSIGVDALVIDRDRSLVAAGTFRRAIQSDQDTLSVERVARWNPGEQRWERMGVGLPEGVASLEVSGSGGLYAAGGRFWSWMGDDWAIIGNEPFLRAHNPHAPVESARYPTVVAADEDYLFVGLYWEYFPPAAEPNNLLYVWKELELGRGRWELFESSEAITLGMDGGVSAIAVGHDGSVHAGGTFAFAGTTGAGIARLHQDSWIGLGTPDGPVFDLVFDDNGALYAAGRFLSIENPDGTVSATSRIAEFDAETARWKDLDGGTDGRVYSIAFGGNGMLYAGGDFAVIGVSEEPARSVARYRRGSGWEPLEGHDLQIVYAVNVDPITHAVYAAGFGGPPGDILVGRIQRWNPGTSSWELLDEWQGSRVMSMSLERPDHAGESTAVLAAVEGLGVWRVTDEQSEPIGGPEFTNSLKAKDDVLYAAGSTAHGEFILARYFENEWTTVASFDAEPFVIAHQDDNVYVGGVFGRLQDSSQIIASANIAKWSPTTANPVSPHSPHPLEGILSIYPNPARHQALVEVTLSTPTKAEVIIFDVLGRIVERLELGYRPAGRHKQIIDLARMAPGTYFLKVRTAIGTATGKLVVL